MATACIPQVTFGFEPKAKPIVATFDMPHASSDGGAVLLKSLDTQLQLTKRLAACVVDGRQPGKIQHQTLELLRQRVFGLACGYADCNDAARLADDAIHKLLVDRDPISGPALAPEIRAAIDGQIEGVEVDALDRGRSGMPDMIPDEAQALEAAHRVPHDAPRDLVRQIGDDPVVGAAGRSDL